MRLLDWYRQHGRDLPWRKMRDPYAILVSEIMLQQTQVDRVIPKYKAWLQAFPNWKKLAGAKRSEVLRLWSGLGYNNRAVRLHALAKLIVEEHQSRLPTTEADLMKLPGIGPYTAGALQAFAFDRPGMCIDVNIERVIKRVHFSKRQQVSRKMLEEVFLSSFPKQARDYANALMDFGSMVCTPEPHCAKCPLKSECKSKGARPEEQEIRAKKRQSTFLHSNRWWRGRILKALAQAPFGEKELWEHIESADRKAFTTALHQLQDEGLVVSGRKLRIRD